MKTLGRTLTIGMFILTLSGVANAGQIATPVLFLGGANQVVCIANNVSNQTQQVTVSILGLIGGFATDTCTLDPGDAGGCQVSLNNDGGYCTIEASGGDKKVQQNFRGVLFNRLTSSPFTIFTSVEAR
jgi:hypothetical protein